MSVIGRLDDQVSEMLIKPLLKKRERKAPEQESVREEQEARVLEAPPEDARAEELNDSKARREELPVWLL
jgi:hypothetical protein